MSRLFSAPERDAVESFLAETRQNAERAGVELGGVAYPGETVLSCGFVLNETVTGQDDAIFGRELSEGVITPALLQQAAGPDESRVMAGFRIRQTNAAPFTGLLVTFATLDVRRDDELNMWTNSYRYDRTSIIPIHEPGGNELEVSNTLARCTVSYNTLPDAAFLPEIDCREEKLGPECVSSREFIEDLHDSGTIRSNTIRVNIQNALTGNSPSY